MIKKFYYSLLFITFVGLIILACLGKNDYFCGCTLRVSISIFLCAILFWMLSVIHKSHKIDVNAVTKENNDLKKVINEKDFLLKQNDIQLNRLELFYNLKIKKDGDKSFSELHNDYQEFVKVFEDKDEKEEPERKVEDNPTK